MKYFKVTIKTQQIQENGTLASVNLNFLVKAVSYTEAEARVCQLIEDKEIELEHQAFEVTTVTKTSIFEIVPPFDDCDGTEYNFLVKTKFYVEDEKTGKTKKVVLQSIVFAKNIKHCIDKLSETLDTNTTDIVSVAESNILETFE